MPDDSLPPAVQSLRRAVADRPGDVPLRVMLGQMLLDHGAPVAAIAQASAALELEPSDQAARDLLSAASAALGSTSPHAGSGVHGSADRDFDWAAAEEDLDGAVAPAFFSGDDHHHPSGRDETEEPGLSLADVGGLHEVKRRLDLAFLMPLRSPDLRDLYGRSLPGGMLLYGPPGCGKTYLARAVAGELGARFHAIGLADILDMWIGASERNLHDAFELARRHAPCVLFLDEIDALGQKRSQMRGNAAMRGTVNQLLSEMDSVQANNDGVFVLGATNHPWDVDSALLRPGRFDRMLLVVPPDGEARAAILRHHLRDRPLEGIDVESLVKRTEHFSGADLAHLCDSAAELALEDSVRHGNARPLQMHDFDRALREVAPSTGAWLDEARNVAMFANQGGRFDELVEYLKGRKLL
jgi:SpoVK/Ycf46/Vps4 family AAA+-type ATPase